MRRTRTTPIGDRLQPYRITDAMIHTRTTPIGDRLQPYRVAAPRPENRPTRDTVAAVLAVKGMILDAGASFDTAALPYVPPAGLPHVEASLTGLARLTPAHKWNRLCRLEAAARHYGVDARVKAPRS